MIYWTDWNIYTLRLPGWIRFLKIMTVYLQFGDSMTWQANLLEWKRNIVARFADQIPAESIQVAWRLLQVCSPASGRARAPTWARETRLGNWTPLKPPIFEEDYVGILSHFFFQQESVSKMTPSRIQSKVSQKFLPVSFIQVAESRME